MKVKNEANHFLLLFKVEELTKLAENQTGKDWDQWTLKDVEKYEYVARASRARKAYMKGKGIDEVPGL